MKRNLKSASLWATILGALTVGCQQHEPSFEPFHLGMIDEDLSTIDIEGTGQDCGTSGSFVPFCAIFEERKNQAVEAFVRERSQHFITMQQMERIRVEPLESTLQYNSFVRERPRPKPKPGQREGVMTAAANMSPGLYGLGAVNGVVLRVRGEGIDTFVKSTRSGIFILPDDYRMETLFRGLKEEKSQDEAKKIDRGLEIMRQGTLIHEARHSDCTGGIDEATIRSAKLAYDRQDFVERSGTRCGNPHTVCTKGVYRGYDACERIPWGSYAVGLVFLMEARKKLPAMSPEAILVEHIIIDLRSRFEDGVLDVDAMLSGKLGEPGIHHDSSCDLNPHQGAH